MMRDKRGNLPVSDRLRRCREPDHTFCLLAMSC